jgi:hypothetical protein
MRNIRSLDKSLWKVLGDRSLRGFGLQPPRVFIEFESSVQEPFVTLVRHCQSERAATAGEASQALGMEQ